MRKFLFYYVVALVLIQLLMVSGLEDALLLPLSQLLTWMAAGIISLFGTDLLYQGVTLRHGASGTSIEVAEICNAVELLLLLASAIIAFPTTVKSKLMGLVFAVFAVQGLNIVRIVTLFYVLAYFPSQFNLIHEYIWGLVIVLDVSLCFAAWVFYDFRKARRIRVAEPGCPPL